MLTQPYLLYSLPILSWWLIPQSYRIKSIALGLIPTISQVSIYISIWLCLDSWDFRVSNILTFKWQCIFLALTFLCFERKQKFQRNCNCFTKFPGRQRIIQAATTWSVKNLSLQKMLHLKIHQKFIGNSSKSVKIHLKFIKNSTKFTEIKVLRLSM